MYNKTSLIITLIESDRVSLKEQLKVTTPIKTISYFSCEKEKHFPFTRNEILSMDRRINNPVSILLGNNFSALDSYIEMIELLYKMKVNCSITCMMNYSFTQTRKVSLLETRGKELFGDNFYIDKEFYSLRGYFLFMNKFDVYICGVRKQTGLGAISTCLKLGKKVFITGANYSWYKKLGAIVFSLEELSIRSLYNELSYEEVKQNVDLIYSREVSSSQLAKWHEVLTSEYNI